ncbi:hypothetical protein JCM25156A_24860 [Komagataeibacter kakiaceti JCM 25156]
MVEERCLSRSEKAGKNRYRKTVSITHPKGISAPEFLDGAQAQKMIEGMKRWKARMKDGKES